jgi:type IV pilus assembly protein PilA
MLVAPFQRTRGFTLIELMIVIGIVGIIAAIAIPNFYRFLAKSRQTEARTHLGGLFVHEIMFRDENNRFSSFSEIGYAAAPSGGSEIRFTYRTQITNAAGVGGAIEQSPTMFGPVPPENSIVAAASSQYGFTGTAVGNLDNDDTWDMWHVNDLKQDLMNPDVNDATQ